MSNYKDIYGEVNIDKNKYWGASTQRSLENFYANHEKMPLEVIYALVYVKMAAAKANFKLNKLDTILCQSILKVGEIILNHQLDDNFPLVVWQTGSGTQSNMNVNEVIANYALKHFNINLHANDHVNQSQSSNDSFPTAMHIATLEIFNKKLAPVLNNLIKCLEDKTKEFAHIIKIGRTHLMDATPLSLAQEFDVFKQNFTQLLQQGQGLIENFLSIPQGATAVGSGLNAPKGFSIAFCQALEELGLLNFKPMENLALGLSNHDNFVLFNGWLSALATALSKMANDIRLLASGPRCGIGELILPSLEAGSSIMPGKVNPTQCESLSMICAQVLGNSQAVNFAALQGHLQLNVFKPLIIDNTLRSVKLLSHGIESFIKYALRHMQANKIQIQANLEKSLMLITKLNPHIGYDRASMVAKNALNKNISIKESLVELEIIPKIISMQEAEELLDPKNMI